MLTTYTVVINIDLEGLKKGEKVCLRVLGNPLPFAVGDSLVSWETIVTYGMLLITICKYIRLLV